MAHDNIIERAEMCWVFDKELRRHGSGGTEVLALNVSKYLRKLESNDGSPLKGLRGAGFFTEDCEGAGQSYCVLELSVSKIFRFCF